MSAERGTSGYRLNAAAGNGGAGALRRYNGNSDRAVQLRRQGDMGKICEVYEVTTVIRADDGREASQTRLVPREEITNRGGVDAILLACLEEQLEPGEV